jgi:hypothetical protein
MNKIDAFVILPPNFDSPIVRDFIHRYHTKFNKIYYLFSHSYAFFDEKWKPYINFIQQDLDGKCEFIHHQSSGKLDTDWRDECVQEVLKKSTGDYILSLEPDFSADWDSVLELMLNNDYELCSTLESNFTGIRLWPCFWSCKKSTLAKLKYQKFAAPVDERVKNLYKIDYNKYIKFENITKENTIFVNNKIEFYNSNKVVSVESEKPIYYDHFDLVSTQLFDFIQDDGKQFLMLNRYENIKFHHYTGITHDYLMMYEHGRKARNPPPHDPMVYDLFYKECLTKNLNFFPEWIEISKKIITR